MMIRLSRPEIARASPGNEEVGSLLREEYGDCPLFIQSKETPVIQMSNFIRCMQSISRPISYNCTNTFEMEGERYRMNLKGLTEQRLNHRFLLMGGFDPSLSPFRLEKWDTESNQWCQLTIDCQIAAACFLVYLEKNPRAKFNDPTYEDQVLQFETSTVLEEDDSFIQVTPSLVNKNPKEGEPIQEWLRIRLSSEVSFPKLRFTTPGVMRTPLPDFECAICFGESDTLQANEKIYMSGCGANKGHCFHRGCIERWLGQGNQRCPICRTAMKNVNE
jgi:hypothetical protein